MQITVNTERLKDDMAKAIKGASCNKMLPITGLISISVSNNSDFSELTFITTDANNYLYVHEPLENAEDFYVVVQVDTLYKLVSKLTSEYTTLCVEDDTLVIHSNGTYKLELPLDENGELIKYPDPIKNDAIAVREATVVEISDIKKICNTAKSALATSLEIPCYTGYYIGKQTIATDTYKICGINKQLFDTPILVGADTLDLVNLADEDVRVSVGEDNVIFSTSAIEVYGKLMDSISNYQVDAISNLLNEDFSCSRSVRKSDLLQLLDRLSIFVGVYDKNAINLTFNNDGLTITSRQANSVENLAYVSGKGNCEDFTCAIDIEMFTSQVKVVDSEFVEIYFGRDNAIKIVTGDVTQIIALLED